MIFKPVILAVAKNDIKESAKWYNLKQTVLGLCFSQAVRNEIKLACANPMSFALKYKNIRAITMTKFPFQIYYIVDDAKKQIIIFAVFHTSRNPNIWKNRLDK